MTEQQSINDIKNSENSQISDTGSGILKDSLQENQQKTDNFSENSSISTQDGENKAISQENSPKSPENQGIKQENEENNRENQEVLFSEQGIRELKRNFPAVDIEALRKSESFQAFLGLIAKNPTLSQIYAVFNSISASIEEKSEKRTLQAIANSKASPGALSSKENQDPAFFTKSQVMEMSREEIRKNLDTIRKSQAKW